MDRDLAVWTLAAFAYMMAILISRCYGCTYCCHGCERSLHGDVEEMTTYGFYDYADPSVLNSSQYLTSLLDTAPCPPPWKLELLCFKNTTNSSILSCSQRVYLLSKCLGESYSSVNSYSTRLCQVLNVCKTFLTCSDFQVQFSNQLSTCINSPDLPKPPPTPKPTTAAPTLKLTTEVTTSSVKVTSDHSTLRNNGSSYNVIDGNSSTVLIDGLHTFLTTEDTTHGIPRTPSPRGVPEEGSGGLSPLVIFFILLICILIFITIVIVIIYRRKRENYKVMRRQWSEVSTTPLQKTEGGYAVFCLQWKRRKNNDVINDDVEANELVEKVSAHDEEDGVKEKLIPGDDLNDDDDIKKDDDQSSGDDNIRYIDDSFEKEDFQDEKKDEFQDEKKDHVNSDWTNPELSAPDRSEKGDSTVANCVDRTLSEGTDVSRREKDGYSDFVNGVVDLR